MDNIYNFFNNKITVYEMDGIRYDDLWEMELDIKYILLELKEDDLIKNTIDIDMAVYNIMFNIERMEHEDYIYMYGIRIDCYEVDDL